MRLTEPEVRFAPRQACCCTGTGASEINGVANFMPCRKNLARKITNMAASTPVPHIPFSLSLATRKSQLFDFSFFQRDVNKLSVAFCCCSHRGTKFAYQNF